MSIAVAIQYAKDVISNATPACQLVHRAAERFLTDLEQAEAKTSAWEFRPDLAERPMRFFALLPNIKGPLAGQKLQAMPYQIFLIANLYGFVERGSTTRRYRQAVIFVPRGNAKTTGMAPLMLYSAFAEGEGGAEAYAAAVSREQAKLLWDTARQMVLQSPDMAKSLGIQAAAHSIYQTQSASKCIAVSSDAKSLEGLSVHFACCDEIASHIDSQVYDCLLTAMGKRKHPLLISISTATGNNTGIGKTLWDYAVRVLNKDQDDDRLFALIYTIDEGDDPWVEATWIKANPGWGVSVQPDAIRAIMRQARNNPAQESAAMTRHLNVWQGADESLFSTRAWRSCADPTLSIDDFIGADCEVAVDLASRVDLASVSIVFPSVVNNRNIYHVFGRHYLNEAAVLDGRNVYYPVWGKDNKLIITSGNETDMMKIESDILDLCKKFRVRSLGFDPWNAVQLSQRLMAQNVNCIEIRQSVSVLSEPTKELSAAMVAGRIHHDGDPVLEWAIGNVVGHYDTNSNVKPNRSREEAKIDPCIALVMALALTIAHEDKTSVYEQRGLLILN